MAIHVIVAGPHYLVRAGLRTALEAYEDITVVGEAATCDELVALCSQASPDVILTDIHLPGEDGVETIAHLTARNPHLSVIALIDPHSPAALREVLRAGARGCLPRSADEKMLADTIRRARAGTSLLPLEMAEALLSAPVSLTGREGEVLHLITRGLTNRQVAAELSVSRHTVQFHVRSLRAKLDAKNRAELSAIAIRLGLVEPPWS